MKIKPIPPGRAASSPTKVPPGTVFPTKYQQDVEERRTFRNRMKVELKNLAKESFLEEMERLRMSNTYIPQSANQTHSPNNDIERQHYLESEIQRLQSVVEDIRKQQPSGGVVGGGNYFPTMNVEWSNHIVRDQMVSPNLPPINSYGGGDFGGRPRAFSESHNDPAYDPPFSTPNPRNQHFVLSSAPIQGFDELIKQETSLFRDTMNFTKSLPGTASHPPHFNHQPHQPHAPAPGHGLNSLSIVEQANRIAEMQSLFQLPATLPSIVSEINSFVDPEYQAMHDYANSPEGRYHERQRKIQIHSEQRDKLEKTISAHKDRLDKGRHPSRRFPLSVPATHNQHRQIVSGQSPRVRIHHQRSLSAPTEGSQKALGESSHTDRADESAANSPGRFAQTAPILANAANPTPFTSRAVSPSAPRSPPRSPKAEKSDGEKNDTAEAKDKPKTADKPPTMTAGEFQVKTDKMKEELRKLVREAVHEELVQEGKALRYTKRFQNHYISTQQPLLVQRIEKSVEDRIKTMQNELAALRTTRLNKTTQRRRHDEDGSTSGSDDEKSRGHGGWFTRNELNGDAEIDMRALTTEINRSVQHIIKRHLGGGGGGGGGGGSYDPNATVVHGHIGSDTYVDDKEVGFENQDPSPRSKPAMNTHTNTAATSNAPQTTGNRAAAAAAAAIVDDPPPKPKSKADRLLGISTDPKTGLQFNEPTPSHKPGLFGSIGNLFHSSKPNAPAHDNSSMMSNRFGSNRSSMYSHQPQPAPPQPSPTPPPSAAFSPAKTLIIVEEGEEDNSQKEKSEKKTKKNRKGSVVSTSEGIANAAATTGQTSAKTDDNSVSGASAMNPSLVAEIAAEETNYRTLMSNLLNAADLKMNVKKELKDWEKEFEGKNGRQPNNEDKMPMSERYIAYKMICNQVQEAKDLVKASEDKLKELKDKAAA